MVEGLKPLLVISTDGRTLFDSKLEQGLGDSVNEDLRGILVRTRLKALVEGEGLTQRSLAEEVDGVLGLKAAKNGNPTSYRAINEYFRGKRTRRGWSKRYIATMETFLLTKVAEYLHEPSSAQDAVKGDLADIESTREFLHSADEIVIGYAMAGAKTNAIEEFYGEPLDDDFTPFKEKGVMVAERTSRAVVGIYVFGATVSAWDAGLRQEFLAHQACMGLFRAFADRVGRLPQASERNPVELAANLLLAAMKSFKRALGISGRGVDPMTGPTAGLILDPFLAYPSWRQFAYARRAKERTYLGLLYDLDEKKEDVALDTIRKVRQAAAVTKSVYVRIAEHAFNTDEWRRIPLSMEDKVAVATDHIDRHFPGYSTLQCDREAIRRMFGDDITVALSAGEREHRQEFLVEDPAAFRKSEHSIQKVWETAIQLAEAKLRQLGVTGDRAIMVCLQGAIAVEIYSYVEDPRFQVKTPDKKTYTPDDTAVFDRAVKVVEQLARAVWSENQARM